MFCKRYFIFFVVALFVGQSIYSFRQNLIASKFNIPTLNHHVTCSLSEIRNFCTSHHSFFPHRLSPHCLCWSQWLKPQEIRPVIVHGSVLIYALLRFTMPLDGTLSVLCAPPLVEGCGLTHEGFGLESRAQDAWGEALTQGDPSGM